MRRRTFAFVLVALAAGGATLRLLPSGAGQHYSAIIQNAANAAGNLTGGGSRGGSASASASTGAGDVGAAAAGFIKASFQSTRGVDVAFGGGGHPVPKIPPKVPTPDPNRIVLLNDFFGTFEYRAGPTGPVIESGTTKAKSPASFVDLTSSLGLIRFTVPTNLGSCDVFIVLVGTGAPSVTPSNSGLVVGSTSTNPARVLVGDINCTSGNSGSMTDGSGSMSSNDSTGVAPPATPAPTPTPTPTPTETPPPPEENTPGHASGGGWIIVDTAHQENHKGTFGFDVEGGLSPSGNFAYHDHLAKVDIIATVIERFIKTGNTVRLAGLAKGGIQWVATVTDGGPGVGTFAITATGPGDLNYSASGTVAGGTGITVS